MKKTAFALLLAVVLTLAGTASARVRKLPLSEARDLAARLADQQLEKRDIVHQHISRSYRRVGRAMIIFRYNDRNTSDGGNGATCTANLVVRWTSPAARRAKAYFTNVRCTEPQPGFE